MFYKTLIRGGIGVFLACLAGLIISVIVTRVILDLPVSMTVKLSGVIGGGLTIVVIRKVFRKPEAEADQATESEAKDRFDPFSADSGGQRAEKKKEKVSKSRVKRYS
jgi:hypothetical protein